MNGFLVTYGPNPRVWCRACGNNTPLVTHVDGTLRPADVEQIKCSHTCGPGTWDVDGERSLATGQARRQHLLGTTKEQEPCP